MKKVGWSSILVATLVLVSGVAADAQQPKKIPRIGYLAADPGAPTRESFRQGLRDFGYVEGQSIHIEWRFTEDKPDRFSEFAAELARLKLDAIVSGSSVAVAILQRTTATIPIVMATYGGDPVADGIVASYANPRGDLASSRAERKTA